MVDALRVQAMVAAWQGCWAKAEQALEEGLALARGMPYPYTEGRLQHVSGAMHTEKGEPEAARKHSHDAAIIDPALQTEQYEMLLRERDFQLRYVIDTHVHADHVSGARSLAARHGAALCRHNVAGT